SRGRKTGTMAGELLARATGRLKPTIGPGQGPSFLRFFGLLSLMGNVTATPSSPPLVRLTLDGRPVAVPAGTTLWEAAREQGIDIPGLCHSPRLTPVGVCRLCVVDVGGRTLAASCVRACEDGMHVRTGGEQVEKQRRVLTGLLLADHPVPCERERTT